ncbi:MAG: radical SAM protein, partial [Elusimicrobia bacterium]|nr:radical SAM protein [Elusimicrobiota bacterium]
MTDLMAAPQFKYIYGPVYSWRLGLSLGIDPLTTQQKYCNFSCPYCQLGNASDFSWERRVFVPAAWIVDEVKALPADRAFDHMTFSGNGEPTLAANLGEMIQALRLVRREKIAVITNSATITRPDVQRDLLLADVVLFKLDAPNQKIFEALNHPAPGIRIEAIIAAIKEFKKVFTGKTALQMMFTEANRAYAPDLARVAREIGADEVELNTPLRPCAMRPLSSEEVREVKAHFEGLRVLSVYEEEKKPYQPFDDVATEKRH